MLVTLMRHGAAAATAPSDALRPLTESGRLEVREVAGQLAGFDLPDSIISSPYLRATQTAEIIADSNQLLIEAPWPEITPAGNVENVLELISERNSPIFLVLHMPLIALLIDALTGKRLNVPTAAVFSMALPTGKMTGAEIRWNI
ncbi:MAG: phosphohistidine phosphatase SixA [Gammaproteobacteria bacterium]|nr:phosphohistidine phosphatase SixA [Gammaproteobacteria bacterium]MBT5602422.1 phosphohistidine phosphatase SixA [Gammaproteobacteria bacterium]MBT6245210.1 phosphohistidine phosphatase SixA [Gammaproteobacteria bacterium]